VRGASLAPNRAFRAIPLVTKATEVRRLCNPDVQVIEVVNANAAISAVTLEVAATIS
jgi:hypothetical protein